MSVAFDEFGRPYIILREQARTRRLKGPEAYRVFTFFFSSLVSRLTLLLPELLLILSVLPSAPRVLTRCWSPPMVMS